MGFLLLLLFAFPTVAKDRIAVMREIDQTKEIMLYDGEKLSRVESPDPWNLYPAISANGRELAFVGTTPKTIETETRILLRHLNTNRTEQWTTGKEMSLHPNLSRNGQFLAVSTKVRDAHQIVIFDLSLERKKKAIKEKGVYRYDRVAKPQIIPSEGDCFFPALSHDGEFLLYQRRLNGRSEIRQRFLKTGKEKLLSDEKILDNRAPSLSPDDRYVAYSAHVEKNWDVYLFDLENGKRRRVTFDKNFDFAPAFRANGFLTFATNRSRQFEIFEINYLAKSSKAARLISDSREEGASLYAASASGELALRISKSQVIPNPARSSFGTARIGNRVFIAGGHQGREHTYPPESFLKRFEVYNLRTKRWRRLADRPVAAHGFGLVNFGRYIYAFGGFQYSGDHVPKWKSTDLIHRYNTWTGRWKEIGKLPRRRSSNLTIRVGNFAYLIGGWDATPRFKKDYAGTFHREVDRIDLRTGEVDANIAQLPDPLRRAVSGTVIGETIYLMGGITQGGSHFNLVDQVTTFNTKTKEWGKAPKLPFPTFAPAAGVMNGQLWMFGGMRKMGKMDYRYIDGIYRLDDKAGWVHVGRKLQERKGFSQVVDLDPNSVLVLGGHSYDNGDAPTRTVERLSWKE